MRRHALPSFFPLAGAVTLLAVCAVGCNGGSATAPAFGTGVAATPTPSPVPLPATATGTIQVGAAAASASLGPVLGGYASTITLPAASSTATLTVLLSATQPAGTPALQSVKRRAQTIGGTGIAPTAFLTLTSNATVTFGATPSVSFVLPAGAAALAQISYVAFYDPTANPQVGWSTLAGPGAVSGNTLTFTGSSASLQFQTGVAYDLALFTVTSALPTPSPTPSPVPTASPTPTPSPIPTASPTPTATPTPSVPSLNYAFGLDPTGSTIGIPPVGRNSTGTTGYTVIFGYPSSNANGVIVSLTEYALENSAPVDNTGDVFEMTLSPGSQGTGNAPIVFTTDNVSAGSFTIESSLFDLSKNYTMFVRNAGTATRTTPRMPKMGFPGHFLYFPSPFSGLTVANNDTVTLYITQQ